MSETINTSEPKKTFKINKRGIGVIAAGSVIVGSAGGWAAHDMVDATVEHFKPKVVYEEVINVPSGSLINAVSENVTHYLESKGEDVTAKLPFEQIVSSSANAADEWKEKTGETAVQPSATFDLKVSHNEAGTYSVDVTPKFDTISANPDDKAGEANK